MWVAISAVLLTILRTKGFGLSMLTALSWQVLVISGFAFVDDTNLIHTALHPDRDSRMVLQEAQEAMNQIRTPRGKGNFRGVAIHGW